MTVTRALAAVLLVALTGWLGVGAAVPASAQPAPTAGFFSYMEEGLPPVKWSLSPTCVPSWCVLHVTSSTAAQNTQIEVAQNFGGVAQLSGGQWTMAVNKPSGIDCGDGTWATSVDIYRFDQAQTSGTHTITHTAVCGLQPASYTKPFGLRFDAPPPLPIDPYPLHCQTLTPCLN